MKKMIHLSYNTLSFYGHSFIKNSLIMLETYMKYFDLESISKEYVENYSWINPYLESRCVHIRAITWKII